VLPLQECIFCESTPPTFSANFSVPEGNRSAASCAALPEPPVVKGIDCEGVEYTADLLQSYSCGVVTRTWTVTDSCGGVVSGQQRITVQDTSAAGAALEIVVPPDVELECSSAGVDKSPEVTGAATASSICGVEEFSISHVDQVDPASCGRTKTILRKWTATNDCGISTSAIQKIQLADTTPPEIEALLETSVTCAFPHPQDSITVSDTCGAQSNMILQPNIKDRDCNGYTILWSVNDECDNYNGWQQFVTITDDIPPTIVPPANLTLECGASNLSPVDTGYATASDNCGYVSVDYEDSLENEDEAASSTSCSYVIRRIWTAMDGDESCARNEASIDQWITVQDTTAPTLIVPPDVTLACGDNTGPDNTGTASGIDACSGVTLSFDDGDIEDKDDFPPAYKCGTTISRTWIAEDECGNVATGVQSITVEAA
jgi:hypothetical protein